MSLSLSSNIKASTIDMLEISATTCLVQRCVLRSATLTRRRRDIEIGGCVTSKQRHRVINKAADDADMSGHNANTYRNIIVIAINKYCTIQWAEQDSNPRPPGP